MWYRFLDVFGRDQPSRLRHNLRLSTADACTATPLVYITVGGNFIVAALVTKYFGLDNRIYGLIASLPAWCNALQVLLVPVLARWFSSRTLSIGGGALHALSWALITVALPWLPRDDATVTARLLFVLIALTSVSQSFAAVGWTSWVQEWLPRRLRGKYFGVRNRASGLVTVAFFLFVGSVTERAGNAIWGYQVIFGAATALRVFSLMWQSMKVTPPSDASSLVYLGWAGQFRRLAQERMFVRFVIYGAVAAFLMNFAGPFYPVFSYEILGLSVDQFSLLVLLATVGGAVTWPWWGRFADRHGCRNAIMLSLCLWGITDIWWPFLTPGPGVVWALYFMWLWGGAMTCGFFVGTFNWLLKLVPPTARVAGVSLNLALTSLMAAIAPVLAGFLLQSARGEGEVQADMTYRAIFFAKPLLQLVALLLLRGIAEPAGAPFMTLLGAMRTQRQVFVMQFLPFLANFHASGAVRRTPPDTKP